MIATCLDVHKDDFFEFGGSDGGSFQIRAGHYRHICKGKIGPWKLTKWPYEPNESTMPSDEGFVKFYFANNHGMELRPIDTPVIEGDVLMDIETLGIELPPKIADVHLDDQFVMMYDKRDKYKHCIVQIRDDIQRWLSRVKPDHWNPCHPLSGSVPMDFNKALLTLKKWGYQLTYLD